MNSVFCVHVTVFLLGLLALVNAHPIALDGSSLLGTAIEHTPSVLHFLGAIKQSVSTPDVLTQVASSLQSSTVAASSDPLSLATSLTATLIGGGIAMYLT